MFGFVRMTSVVLGSAVLAISLLNQYLGRGTGSEMLCLVPGYSLICDFPIAAVVIGGSLVLGALMLPSGGRKPRGWT